MIRGPWVRNWKRRMKAYAEQNGIRVPDKFRANTVYWGPHAEVLAKRVKQFNKVVQPTGKLDGKLRRILRNVPITRLAPPYLGIDVSNHNGTIDWQKVRADRQGIKFAWVKVTESTGYVDKYASGPSAYNLRKAREAGIIVGAYAYVHPGSVEYVLAQIDHFLRHADYRRGDLAPAIDWEESSAASPTFVKALEAAAQRIKDRTGVWPVIYGGYYVLNPMNIPKDSVLKNCALWLPAYGRNDGARYPSAIPGVPSPWRKYLGIGNRGWAVHQYTSNGSVNGISGRVDVNYSIVPIEDLM